MRLVHLTDPHLSSLAGHALWGLRGKRRLGYLSWVRRRRHHHRREVLEALCAHVRTERADVIAVTGDLTQLGLPDEIVEAGRWLDGFAPTPVALVPGNHDFYRDDAVAAVIAAWGGSLRLVGAPDSAFPSRLDVGPMSLIGLCSAYAAPFWSAGGRLGDAQLARLDALLAQTRGRLRCVLIHHPPLPRQCPARKALADAAALGALLERQGVELVLHGHMHRNLALAHASRTRVLATASASYALPAQRASYRVFDVSEASDAWHIGARLMTLGQAPEDIDCVEQTRWRVARP
ncbi:MAG: metallophosphoesterase [Gammaproteobacteria bacterium]